MLMMQNAMQLLQENLAIIAPLIVIQIILMIAALISLIRTEETNGPKWVWALVIVIFNTLGPIAYFIFGRRFDA
ncbi:Phospholipase_D-nuclease N-terminal [Halobacillus alkaliphilus]|uniref:Phospholipase_D-nuclease N-terminal n=1 Tax=Halobacillus alkaliphilus TaxID=396056 RepID=A0A1I2N383_9BACI|nr:Phospholipase_D-nuclease N-terminal [Halobacillus alkaliphilus]